MAFPTSVTLCNGLRGALTFQQWWTVDTLWLQKGQEKCVMGIQTWCGLGSVKNKYGKKPYTIFWDAFGYPGQPHGVAILGSEFPGPHHFHMASHRQRGTKGTCSGTTNCTQFVTATEWLKWDWAALDFDLWEPEWQLRPATLVWMGLLSSAVTEESCSGSCESLPADKDHQLHGAADLFFSKLCCELLFYSVNQISFISSPAPVWKNIWYTPIYNIHGSTWGYSNHQRKPCCKEQVPDTKGQSMTSCKQWKSLFCWTAFSIN